MTLSRLGYLEAKVLQGTATVAEEAEYVRLKGQYDLEVSTFLEVGRKVLQGTATEAEAAEYARLKDHLDLEIHPLLVDWWSKSDNHP